MIRCMANSASSTRGASLLYAMFLTNIFKYFSVELEEEEGIEVKSMVEGRQVKPQAFPRKYTRQAAAKAKGKSPFVDVSNDEDDPAFMAEKVYR